MALAIGTRVGAYEIVSLLGAGGMGEVYRARDTRLKREVALKVLLDTFSGDPDRLARFQREAELLATINHPNIATVFGLEESDDRRAIVMELVEGPTLAERLYVGRVPRSDDGHARRGPAVSRDGPTGLPVEEALAIARQLTDALEAAHERGIVHRDLKPANIKIQPNGHVKVLDFGLAKLNDPNDTNGPNDPNGLSPTLSLAATRAGVILGTAAYMSPEQARGKAVDRRTDIWAFGCVLYEMLTGTQAFATIGETVSDIVAAVLRGEPDWAALPAATPSGIRRVLRRCLAKDSRERLHDIADARLDIDEAMHAPTEETMRPAVPTQTGSGGRVRALAATVVILAAALLGLAALFLLQPAPERLETQLDLVVPALINPNTTSYSIVLSPDGRQLAFIGPSETSRRVQLWVRSLDQPTARPLPGTDGASTPFWAPDSRAIGFFAESRLKRVDLTGGPAQAIADAPVDAGATWSSNGTIVFASGEGLMRVAVTGGTVVPVTRLSPGQRAHFRPQFLPDGRRFLFFVAGLTFKESGVYVGSLDGGEPVWVVAAESRAIYSPPNWLVLVRDRTLLAFPFDAARAVTTGDPVPLAENVAFNTVSTSATGALTYLSGGVAQARQLVWRDRTGRLLGAIGEPDNAQIPSLSLAPDGRRIATSRTTQGNQDVWLIEVTRGVPSRFTFAPGADNAPIWSSDGQRILFRSNRNGRLDLFEKPASGAGDEEPLLVTPESKIAYDWSSDGRTLLYGVASAKTGADIWALPLTGDRKAFPVVQTSFAEDAGQLSPDGRWVAYESNESGQFEIYAQAFPTARGKWQISIGGGIHPRWGPDGRELFYVDPNGRLMAVPVTVGSNGQSLEVGTPVALFTPRLATGASILQPGDLSRPLYDVAPDGRFLLNEAGDDAEGTVNLTIVLNWDAGLR